MGGGAGPRVVGSQETRPQAPKPSQAGGGPSSLPEPHRSRLRNPHPPWCSHPPAWETGPRGDCRQMLKRNPQPGGSECAASGTRAERRGQETRAQVAGKMSRPGRAAEQRRRTATTRERQAETSSSVPREERREPVDGGKEDFPERAQNPASRRPNQQRLHPDDPRTRRARGFGCSARLRRLSPGLPSSQNAVLFHSPTLLMSPAGA